MIYIFDPILRPMVWGSELWVLSGYPERLSVVSEGPAKGLTINQLAAREKERLLGSECYRNYGDEFPLVIKFLDVHAPLSIQVHPSEEFAQARQGLHGKTEMWYVVRAEKDAELMCGFSQEITPDDYTRLISDGSITDVIARHKIAGGDVFFLPPGRIHALLPGAYVAEIQQSSDSTYRIWDYNRPGLDGKPRALHTELAREALNYKVEEDYRTHYELLHDAIVPLVSCAQFTTSLLDLTAPYSLDLGALDSFVTVLCIEGSGEVFSDGERTVIVAGACLLVPACSQGIDFVPDTAGLKLLISHI